MIRITIVFFFLCVCIVVSCYCIIEITKSINVLSINFTDFVAKNSFFTFAFLQQEKFREITININVLYNLYVENPHQLLRIQL